MGLFCGVDVAFWLLVNIGLVETIGGQTKRFIVQGGIKQEEGGEAEEEDERRWLGPSCLVCDSRPVILAMWVN